MENKTWIGRIDGSSICMPTEQAAEEVLAVIQKYDSDGVAAGDYFIDVYCPEESGVDDDEPTDDQIYNRPGVEGGIGYPLGPEAMHENDWRL